MQNIFANNILKNMEKKTKMQGVYITKNHKTTKIWKNIQKGTSGLNIVGKNLTKAYFWQKGISKFNKKTTKF